MSYPKPQGVKKGNFPAFLEWDAFEVLFGIIDRGVTDTEDIALEKFGLEISVPTVLTIPIAVSTAPDPESTETDEEESEEPPEVSPKIEEEDLNNLTIPAVYTDLDSTDSDTSESSQNNKLNSTITMADETIAQRAYIKEISSAIPEFNGQKLHLQRFVTALKLVNLTKGTFEHIAVEVIKSKIVGSTLYKVQDETTINDIIRKLQDTVVGETSDVIKAKMAKTVQKGKTAEKFTTDIDNLRKLLEASYIDEGLSAEHADKFSTKEAISTMVKNCEHGRLKTILEAGNFTTMNEAVTKYIQCSTEMTGNANTILYAQRGNNYRGNNYRNNYRGRGNSRGYYRNNGYNQNNQNNGHNRSYNNNNNNNNYYRGNNRGGNNRSGNNSGSNQNNRNNQNNVRLAQTNSENQPNPSDI
nr:GATA zinc finger domain-containing protein 4-like [Drosophila kikkawai]